MEKDLYKYAERKMPFFNFTVSLWSHYKFLENVFGEGFSNSVFLHKEGVCELNASEKQMREVSARILEKVKKHDPILTLHYEKAKIFNKDADKLLAEYQSGVNEINEEAFDRAFSVFENNFSYCTILPYWVLYAINEALEKGESKDIFEKEMTMYEELKGETRYPQLVQGVISHFFKKAAKILDASVECASCMTPEELRLTIGGGKAVSCEELEKRWAWCAITPGEKPYKVNFSFNPSELAKVAGATIDARMKEIKGSIAYKGIVRGRAKIVNAIDDMKKFEEGDILVSIQSSPSLMSAILKCSAIVTDEGGIMCHASIISRELKKPCIIGTKIATKLIKDGDMVEVDAEKGIVTILK
jgi:pyruvate, water dikinase